jgi:hypothetical protein
MAGAEAVSHHDKQSTGALLARFLGLGCFDDRSVEPGFPHFQVVFTDEPSVPSVYPAVLVRAAGAVGPQLKIVGL